MNNRYFGNIHDFYKYALLRLLTGLSSVGGECKALFNALGVCWMLTTDKPGKPEVGREYLRYTEQWGVKKIDEPLLFKFLEWQGQNKLRQEGVGLLHSNPELLRGAKFFDASIEEKRREVYFTEMRAQFKKDNRDLIFLDPDYGLALGARDWGPGFLPASEVVKCYQDGFSVLFYQSQYGSQPDSARLIRGELRRAFGGILPPVYALEANKDRAGLKGRHEEAGIISPIFFLLPQPEKHGEIREFLSRFRTRMWQRKSATPVFNIPGRIGVFVDYDNCWGQDKIFRILREVLNRWGDKFAEDSGIFWNGNLYRGENARGKKYDAENPEKLKERIHNQLGERIPIHNMGEGPQAVDAAISKRIRACVEHGEVDVVVLFSADGDFKLDKIVAGKHGVVFQVGKLKQ